MKRAITLELPMAISKKLVAQDNPPWSEKMLGEPVFKRGRGRGQHSQNVVSPIHYQLIDRKQHGRNKTRKQG